MIALLRLPRVGCKESNKNDSNVCDLNIIFTDLAWEVGDVNTCPSCRESPVQLLFTAAVSKDFTLGQCMLCRQLIAYKKNITSRKRSRNIDSNYNLGNIKLEVLNFLTLKQTCTKHKHRSKRKNNINQLALNY